MPVLPTKPMSGTQLVTGILGTVDLGALIAKVIDIAVDLSASATIMRDIQKQIDTLLPMYSETWKKYASQDTQQVIADSQTFLKASMKELVSYIRDQTGLSAVGKPMSATMKGHQIKNWNAFWGLDTLFDLTIGIPQTIVIRKAERYWNKTVAPELPSDRDALIMAMLGLWSWTKYRERIREIDGLTTGDATNVSMIRYWQIGKPSLRDAYAMVCKNIKKKDYFMSLAQWGFGFEKQDAEDLFTHLSYDPSVSEMLRLSDLIPLDSKWVEKKLKAQTLDAEDRAIFLSGIEKRQIRDEVNKAWSIMLDCYQWGLFVEKTLRELLANWKFGATEIDLRIQTAELLKVKLRVKLLRDAEIYLYRKDVIDEDALLDRLVALTIGKDVANAIVRNEAAKKGIEWEIPEE